MKLPSQKFLSVLFAVLLGAGIIFFAWRTVSYTGKTSYENGAGGDMLANDSWRDALKVIPQDSLTRLVSAQMRTAGAVDFATTSTDVLARELLTSYALAQKSIGATPMSEADTQTISDLLSGKMMADTTLKQYTNKDLIIVQMSTSTFAVYVDKVSRASLEFSHKNTIKELTVVAQAIESKDAQKLAPLKGLVNNLTAYIKSLLAIPVPQEVAPFHLFLIQNHALVLSGIEDMQRIISDPARGLRGMAKYQKGMNMLTSMGDALKGSQSHQ